MIAADPLETDIPASSGPGIYNVTAAPYNADKTGATITSGAIQQAIDAANQAGGGIVYIPAGVYKSSNLTLKSNVTFYLAGGAVIVGTGRARTTGMTSARIRSRMEPISSAPPPIP